MIFDIYMPYSFYYFESLVIIYSFLVHYLRAPIYLMHYNLIFVKTVVFISIFSIENVCSGKDFYYFVVYYPGTDLYPTDSPGARSIISFRAKLRKMH